MAKILRELLDVAPETLDAFIEGYSTGTKSRRDTIGSKFISALLKEREKQEQAEEREAVSEEIGRATETLKRIRGRHLPIPPPTEVPEMRQGVPTGRMIPFKPVGLRRGAPETELRPVTEEEIPEILGVGTAGTIARFPRQRAVATAGLKPLLPERLPREKAVFTPPHIERTIGDLEAGESDIFNIFVTREDAVRHIYQQLGRNWETILSEEKVTEIREVLDRKYPEEGITGTKKTGENVVIMRDAAGNRAEVEVDASGNPIRVIRELP